MTASFTIVRHPTSGATTRIRTDALDVWMERGWVVVDPEAPVPPTPLDVSVRALLAPGTATREGIDDILDDIGGVQKVANLQGVIEAQALVNAIKSPLTDLVAADVADPTDPLALIAYLTEGVRKPGTVRAEVDKRVRTVIAPTTIFARDYCAEDGVTDDGPGLNAAGAALIAAGGGVLQLSPAKTYYVNTDVNITAPDKDIKVAGLGTAIQAGPNAVEVFKIQGTLTQVGGDNVYVSGTKGSNVIQMNSPYTAELPIGSLMMLWSDDIDNPARPTDYMTGEPVRITERLASPNRLKFDRTLRFNHTSGASKRRVYRVNPVKASIVGITFRGHDNGDTQRLSQIMYADGASYIGCYGTGKSVTYGLMTSQSLNVAYDDCEVKDIWDRANPTSPLAYAFPLSGVVAARLTRLRSTRTRHAIDVGSYSTATKPGFVSTDISATDCVAYATWAPPFSVHHGRNIVFDRTKAIGCGGGWFMRGIGWTIKDSVWSGALAEGAPDWGGSTRVVKSIVQVGEGGVDPSNAGDDVTIENLAYEALPADWNKIVWANPKGPRVRIAGFDPTIDTVAQWTPVTKARSTALTVTNANVGSGAMLDDDQLTVAVGPGTYTVRAVLFYDAGTTGDLLLALARPAGATFAFGVTGLATSVTSGGNSASMSSPATVNVGVAYPVGGANGGSSRYLMATVEGTVTTTVAGSIGLRYAQNASDATAATIAVGSRMTVQQIS